MFPIRESPFDRVNQNPFIKTDDQERKALLYLVKNKNIFGDTLSIY